jgi:hypothetical protein
MKNNNRSRRILGKTILLAAVSTLAACVAVPVEPAISGYTCCNMRSYDGWISSNNIQGGDLIAAGEPARFDLIKKNYYIYGMIGGTDIALRDDTAKNQEDTLRWARRIIVSEDPRQQLTKWSPDVQKAVNYGRVFTGMTREQVLMSLGYPSIADTPDLNSESWRYWTGTVDQSVDLNFGKDQKLVSITGKPSAVRMIEAMR